MRRFATGCSHLRHGRRAGSSEVACALAFSLRNGSATGYRRALTEEALVVHGKLTQVPEAAVERDFGNGYIDLASSLRACAPSVVSAHLFTRRRQTRSAHEVRYPPTAGITLNANAAARTKPRSRELRGEWFSMDSAPNQTTKARTQRPLPKAGIRRTPIRFVRRSQEPMSTYRKPARNAGALPRAKGSQSGSQGLPIPAYASTIKGSIGATTESTGATIAKNSAPVMARTP
jgi:hypothetical protein